MITLENLPGMLEKFGFKEQQGVYKNEYTQGAKIEVDFNKRKITYSPRDENFKNGDFPSMEKQASGFVVHRDTTLNFDAAENFVCLVCVHLLLKKGYGAKHIVIEPSFKVGYVDKPSYGDILVFDKEYNPLVLIENKTYGAEFSREWNNMQKDGGQLFSYLGPLVNICGMCGSLVLFAADFSDGEAITKSNIITLKDNEKRIGELDSPKTFKDAQGKYFDVWSETYGKSFETKGLFEDGIAAYTVGKSKYTIKDLKKLSHAEIRPIYHEFATVLREHAITDFEHSFYILVDLFLCKITDELNNPDDLQFYYKGIARDTPKEYCGRLLDLYKLGKKQLFNVDVVNKNESDVRDVFEKANRSLYNGLFDGIRKLFEEVKFYNIKKFNFIDVENKEEFDKNFEILIKITALIQDINLSSSETNHFFGDLFEGLLSKNVHQTEGQFFTPVPIVDFIIQSLPDFTEGKCVKVLDYACGAGHFLTEFVKRYREAQAFGIEKSPNLSQVAKIATIINGDRNARIVFKDALERLDTELARFQGFDYGSFDCIVSNPPYSVKGFLNTLSEKDRGRFALSRLVKPKSYDSSDSIECYFIELAKKFLKNKGVMGIVLPSSILVNKDDLSKGARDILFSGFNILAVIYLNERTFGSTSTRTAVLFAQRTEKNAEGKLKTFISKGPYEQYKDHDEIDLYTARQGYGKAEFSAFIQDGILGENLAGNEIFKEYRKSFRPKEISRKTQSEWFKSSSMCKDGRKEKPKEYSALFGSFLKSGEYKAREKAEEEKQFVSYAQSIEKEKLLTFIETCHCTAAVLEPPNGKDKAESVKFLGYDWSNRKGDEGIKYVVKSMPAQSGGAGGGENAGKEEKDRDDEAEEAINSINYIDTPLYNPDNGYDSSKFSYAVRKHIYGQCETFSFGAGDGARKKLDGEFSSGMGGLLSFRKLADMIDFSRADFDRAIKNGLPATENSEEMKSKFPMVKLGEVAPFVSEHVNSSEMKKNDYITTDNLLQNRRGMKEFEGELNFDYAVAYHKNDILISNIRPYLKKIWFADRNGGCSPDVLVFRASDEKVLPKYLFEILSQDNFFDFVMANPKGLKMPRGDKSVIPNYKIPLPPLSVQKEIAAECEKVDLQRQNAEKEISGCKSKISEIMAGVKGEEKRLGEICSVINPSKSDIRDVSDDTLVSFVDMPSVSNDGFIETKVDKRLKDVRKGSYTYFAENDIIIAKITPCMENGKCAIAKNLTNKIGLGSSEFHVFRIKQDYSTEFVFAYLNRNEIRKAAQKTMTGSSGHRRVPITFYEDLRIPLPPLSIQQKIVGEISALEEKIASAKKIIASCPEQKREILKTRLEK